MEPKKPDDIFARRRQIEVPLDPNRYTALRRPAADPSHRLSSTLVEDPQSALTPMWR
jgi:hypothetical protein